MMQRYGKFGLFAIVFTTAFLTVAVALRYPFSAQVNTQGGGDDNQYPIVDLTAQASSDEGNLKKRQSKGKKYNKKDASVVNPVLVDVTEHYHWPADFPALPVSQSALIVLAQVRNANAYLSSDGTGVYSEFTIHINEVLKNTTPEPLKAGDTLAVEREGGRVLYSSGHISKFSIVGFGMPRAGGKYVLFIKKVDDDSQIVTGYELRAGTVTPLDTSGVVNFDQYRGWNEHTFLAEVRAAVGSK